jgi:hypothetical protein
MDDLASLILGEEPKTTTKKSSGVNDYNLGNIRPAGSSTGFVQSKSLEQGIKDIDENLKAYGEKHGINTLRGVISRWSPPSENDTESLIKAASQKTGLKPDEKIDLSNPVIRHIISGPIILQEKGIANLKNMSNPQTTGTKSSAPAMADDLGSLILGTTQEPEAKPVQVTQTATKPMNAGEKMYQERLESLKKLGIGLSSLADVTVGGVIPQVAGAVAYPLARVLRSPEEAQAITNKVTSTLENPFGKTFGVTESPVYKGEASRRLMDLIGENLGLGAKAISEKTGIPTSDVQSYINSLMLASGKPVSEATGKVTSTVIGQGQKLAQEFKEAAQPTLKTEIVNPVEEVAAGSAGAAKSTTNPFSKFTGQETGKGGEFPMVKLSNISKDVPTKEQQTRAQIATEILGNKDAVRTGVITGNEDTLRNEHTEAKSSNQTPKAQLLRDQIANEQNALSNYAQDIIDKTGASKTLTSDYERGQAINDAFAGENGLTGFIKKAKQNLYDEAKAKVGDNPITTSHVDNLFNNEQFKAGAGLKGNEGVLSSAQKLIDLARNVGFEDEHGNTYAPNTIGAWDAVRKSLNAEWTQSNASMIRKINQAIDKDIASAGGQELYKKADQLHQAEKTLFASKGIKSIFGEIDPNGVQTGTPFEQIPSKLNKIPKDEWVHIYDTAEKISKGVLNGPIDKETGMPKWSIEIPEEVRQNAERAKAEIKGAIAREVYENGSKNVGVWNQKNVNSILNARSEKIKHAFDPEEIRRLHILNVGGQIMPGVHGYEGAGLQAERIGMLAENAPKLGAAAGATVGSAFGPLGTAIGTYGGQKAGAAFSESQIQKALNKSAEQLKAQMKKNAQKASILNLRENKKD